MLIKLTRFALILSAALIGCGDRPSEQRKTSPPTQLKRKLIKEEFGKGNFLSASFGMYFKQNLYVPDQAANRVFKLDKELEPILILGEAGEGPGGLAGPGFVFAGQERVFVDTGATRRISSFDTSGNFLNATPVNDFKRLTRFVAFDDFLFISSPNKEQPFTVIDLDGNIHFGFGSVRFKDDPRIKDSRNFNHLLLSEDGEQPLLISVGLSEPDIDVYDLEGKHLSGFSYNNFPQARSRLDSIDAFYKTSKPNQMRMLVSDVCNFGNQVYIFLYSAEKPFHILHFEVSSTDIHFKDTLTIHDDLFPLSMATDGTSFYILEGRTHFLFVYERG